MGFSNKKDTTVVYEKAIINRVARSIGHLRSVITMVETGRDCSEVLIQLAAVKSEINNTGKEIMKNHMWNLLESETEDALGQIEELNELIEKML